MTHPETLLARAGGAPDEATGALVPPIHLSTTYERAADGSYPGGYRYARTGNPTRERLEKTLAALEGGAACATFASGMAAIAAVLHALKAGDHVILPDDVYYGVRTLLDDVMQRWQLSYTAVDMTDLDALREGIEPETRLVWIETPSNPLLKITDLAAAAEVAHAAGARLAVDGTWTTPLLQRPLDLGADLVVHAATKYLGGHSDLLGGAVIARAEDARAEDARAGDAFFERVRSVQTAAGPVLDPFSAWLALRGLRTLAVRLKRQCANARRLARFLAEHPRVAAVHYPGLERHPGHDVARAQMVEFGGMLSFEIDGSAEAARAVANRCAVFAQATSLGGAESLIGHRASVEGPESAVPPALLRLSVGLEHLGDLQADLSQALT